MKKLLTLTSLFSFLCLGAMAQDVEENTNPIIQYKVTGAVSSSSSVSMKDAEENEVMTVTYGPDYSSTKIEGTNPQTYTISKNANWTTGAAKKTIAGQSWTNWVSGSGNPATINSDNTLTSPSLSMAPADGIWVKLTPATNAVVTVFATNVSNSKSIFVVGGATGAKNPSLQYTTGSTDGNWADYENGKNTNAVFGATASSDIAIRFTGKAGVDYYFFLAGSKMRFLGCTYQLSTAGNADEAKKIAWVSPSDEPENDDLYRMYAATDGYEYTAINSTNTEITADSLRKFSAVVISTGVTTDDAIYPLLEKNISFVPMVNLNTSLFGYEVQETDNIQLTAQTNVAGVSTLLDGVTVDEETGEFEYAGVAVGLPERFASDDVLAKNGEYVAFHSHTSNRNRYILLASPADNNLDTDLWSTLLTNAMNMAAESKREVVAAANPAFAQSYANGKTTVKITCATNDSKIYYSLNGEDYQPYTDELAFTEAATVYAYAEAEGYEKGNVAMTDVVIKMQMAAPEISQSHEPNSTSITLSADGDAKIYYSFINETNTANMALYTAPVTVSEPCKIYAVAISDMTLQSEQVSAVVNIDGITSENIRIDTLAHMDVNQAEYYEKMKDWSTEKYGTSVGTSASAFYFFGKSAWNYYLLDEEGNVKKDSTNVDGVWQYTYYPNENSLVSFDFGNGWMLKSGGQVGCIECIDAVAKVGHGETERRADSAEDLIYGAPTKGLIDFNGKKTGEPWTLSIETTAKYQGPFDIVTYLGNGSTGAVALVAQVSTDGETWQTIDTLAYSKNQRYWKRGRMSYEGTDEVYFRVTGGGSKGQLYDIYLLNNGELSKQWKPATDTKVGDVNNDGSITMADANAIVNYFLAEDKESIGNFNVEAADANNDGTITMADANAVVNMYLGGEQ